VAERALDAGRDDQAARARRPQQGRVVGGQGLARPRDLTEVQQHIGAVVASDRDPGVLAGLDEQLVGCVEVAERAAEPATAGRQQAEVDVQGAGRHAGDVAEAFAQALRALRVDQGGIELAEVALHAGPVREVSQHLGQVTARLAACGMTALSAVAGSCTIA